MAAVLAANTVLTALSLGGNTIGDAGATALAAALATNTALTSLELDGNTIGAAGASALTELVAIFRRNTHFAPLRRPLLQLMCAARRRGLFMPAEMWSCMRWALVFLCETQ